MSKRTGASVKELSRFSILRPFDDKLADNSVADKISGACRWNA
jgi:hypothetical protein